jgi:multidrug efflux pump subunit AcrA (membrane-fusion protein)
VQRLEVERLKLERDLRRLTAPFDGFVTEIDKRPGEYVAVTEPEVMQLVQLDPLKIQFHVPVNSALKLAAGQSVGIKILCDNSEVAAVIRRVSRVVDPQSGTTLVELELPNKQLTYRSGLKCEWRLPSGDSVLKQTVSKEPSL